MRPFLSAIVVLGAPLFAVAQDASDKYRPTIDKGLAWLVKQQAKDGSWSENNGANKTSITAFAAMALLADGNTINEGKYKTQLRDALNWYLRQQAKDAKYQGVLGNKDDPGSTGRYMPEHGVALSFLSKIYGEIDDAQIRARLKVGLNDAVAFSVNGQSTSGGWFYTSRIEGHNSTENVATMVQIQGLLDARDAGIAVPKVTMTKALTYLKNCTTGDGSILYSARGDGKDLPDKGGRPTITAMAAATYMRNHEKYDEPLSRWIGFCAEQKVIRPDEPKSAGDLLPHYYFCKVAFHLEEKRWAAAFPDKKVPAHLVWKKYRPALFDHLQREQDKDGSWSTRSWTLGPVFNTTMALNILLYENSIPFQLSR
jgi:prenyltransferase beta subunit